MSDLTSRQLVLIKRAAEDAIYACNRHYGPFVDVVAHPLNILALVEMAQMSIEQQAKIDELCKQMEEALFDMRQQALMLREGMDGYKDPAQICQSEGVDMCVRILEKALRGEHESK